MFVLEFLLELFGEVILEFVWNILCVIGDLIKDVFRLMFKPRNEIVD